MKKITLEEILEKRTAKHGWTAKQLAEWGVSWPPKKGWKKRLVKNGYYSSLCNYRRKY